MSDMTLSGARDYSRERAASEEQSSKWRDRMTALFMIVASAAIWGVFGYAFHTRLP